MEIIICGDISGFSNRTNFSINKMSRHSYDVLCANGYLDDPNHINDLFLIDDDNFDVQNKRIVNVGDPVVSSDGDAVNLSYLKQNYINSQNITYYPNTKIVSTAKDIAVSSDCCIYSALRGDNDWKIEVSKGPLKESDLSINYNENRGPESEHGWCFHKKNTPYDDEFRTGIGDKSVLTISYKDNDNIFYAYRDVWKKEDKLIRASELSNWLSCDTFAEFKQCVLNSLK